MICLTTVSVGYDMRTWAKCTRYYSSWACRRAVHAIVQSPRKVNGKAGGRLGGINNGPYSKWMQSDLGYMGWSVALIIV
jgi:hypothetical protein